jgi:hypothetical protein
MDDLNDIASLHSAGATGRHKSPFADLPTYKNENGLSADFIQKWVVPFYMAIGSYNENSWREAIKAIKSEITPTLCLSLLGDFNWRTRLVGAYFAAVKGYQELIDIIGIHLLKSEVCCVGHIYALTLIFFKTDKSIEFLNRYLDYYLTTPNLYFDQTSVMEAVLYLDEINRTDHFKRHFESWKILKEKRKPLERQNALTLAKLIEEQEGKSFTEEYLQSLSSTDTEKIETFSTSYFQEQISILKDLSEYNG